MQAVEARDLETNRVDSYSNFAEFHQLIATQQVEPLRPDGTRARVQELLGGYLVDGVPLNVLMTGEWEEGQRAMMEAYYDSGQIPRPASIPPPDTDAPEKPGAAAEPGRALTWVAAAGVLGFLLGRRFV